MFSVCTIKKCTCYRHQEDRFPLTLEKNRVSLNVPFLIFFTAQTYAWIKAVRKTAEIFHTKAPNRKLFLLQVNIGRMFFHF